MVACLGPDQRIVELDVQRTYRPIVDAGGVVVGGVAVVRELFIADDGHQFLAVVTAETEVVTGHGVIASAFGKFLIGIYDHACGIEVGGQITCGATEVFATDHEIAVAVLGTGTPTVAGAVDVVILGILACVV